MFNNGSTLLIVCSALWLAPAPANAQWALRNNGLTNTGVFSFTLLDGHLFVGTNVGVCATTNNANDWTQVTNSDVALAMALINDGTNVFAGTEGNGIFLSSDTGGSWNAIDNGLTDIEVFAMLSHGPHLFAGTMGGGVFRSDDDGATWTEMNNGLTNTDVRAFIAKGTTLFAGTNGSGIFSSTDDGGTWAPANIGIPPNTWIRSFAIKGDDLFAAGDNGIHRSMDDGATWTPQNSGLATTEIFSLLANIDLLFAGTNQEGIFLSTDAGVSWQPFNDGFDLPTGTAFAMIISGPDLLVAMYSEGVYARPLSGNIGMAPTPSPLRASIHPNPAQNELLLELPAAYPTTEVFVYDASGAQVLRSVVRSGPNKLGIGDLAPGAYHLHMGQGPALLNVPFIVAH